MTDELTPEQQHKAEVDAEIARHQAKLDGAPKGSKLAANMSLRIAIAKASLVADETQRASLEQSARDTHKATIEAITAAEAEDAAADASA